MRTIFPGARSLYAVFYLDYRKKPGHDEGIAIVKVRKCALSYKPRAPSLFTPASNYELIFLLALRHLHISSPHLNKQK